MAQRSNRYWEGRAQARMEFYHKNSDKTVYTIIQAYDKAIDNINQEINNIFETYYFDGVLSPTEARQILNTPITQRELQELKNKITAIDDYKIRRALLNRINAPAYKARITRLEALKENIYVECKKIAEVEIQESTLQHINTINEAYYRHLFDIQKGIGLGFDVSPMPSSTIESILKNPWSGKHFSRRVWGNTDVLASKVSEIVTSGMMGGRSTSKMVKELQDVNMASKFAANRLIRTETTYMANAAEMESYKDAEIDKYRFVATLDLRTSKICREHDGKIYDVKKAVPGENMPALHPFCRSTTIAYLGEDVDTWLDVRIARDSETGKNYRVWADITYSQWYERNVRSKEDIPKYEEMVQKWINEFKSRSLKYS